MRHAQVMVVVAFLLWLPQVCQAQGAARSTPTGAIPAAGRVVRVVDSDTTAVAGVHLVLHRVGRTLQGPVDSTITGTGGRFRFSFVPDTTMLFLLSANYAGIEYFSPPINTNPALPDTALVVVVSDTSTTAPVDLAARYLVARSAGPDGTRPVLDLIVLENRGNRTRVASDTLHPAWAGRIPTGALGARVGEAELSADAIVIRNDSVLVFAPIAPGEKQIAVEYLIPAGADLELPFGQDSVATNILTQDAAADVPSESIAAVDSQTIEGTTFRRWVGAPRQGEILRVNFSGAASGRVPRWVLPALVGLVGCGLLFAVVRLRKIRPAPSLDALTDRIAALEARYEGRQGEVSLAEWDGYLRDGVELRAQLSAHLAARGPKA